MSTDAHTDLSKLVLFRAMFKTISQGQQNSDIIIFIQDLESPLSIQVIDNYRTILFTVFG